MLRKTATLPDLSKATPEEAAVFVIDYLNSAIPNSSTRLSLLPEGYPSNGEIEISIRNNQHAHPKPSEAAKEALKTGCGNCQELAYAGALILRAAGYQGDISIGLYGINHMFLFIDNVIADPWAGVYCPASDWNGKINAYGGSIKKGIMRGRIVGSDSIELEDEVPEVVEKIPANYAEQWLGETKYKYAGTLFPAGDVPAEEGASTNDLSPKKNL